MAMPGSGLVSRAAHALRGAFAVPGRARSGDGFGFGSGRRFEPAYHAASQSGALPVVPDLGPFDAVKFFRPCQRLVRHQYRNDNWVRSLVNKYGELMISTGPVPVSKYPELDDLWCAAARQFDARGVNDLGSWLRDDLFRDYTLDGEGLARRRNRRARKLPDGTYAFEAGLIVPLQFQSLSSAYLPTGDNRAVAGGRVVNGIELDALDRRVAYHPYSRHPRDTTSGTPLTQTRVPASEFYHLHVPSETGALRPEVPLAAGILRSMKNAQFEDANTRVALNAINLAVMFEEDLPEEAEEGPSADEKNAFIESLHLSPNLIARAPTGLKAKMLTPPANLNFSPTIRLNLLYICAGMGVPVHEVTGDFETITERAMSFAGISLRRKADIEHARIEHQILNPARIAFVDTCVAFGLWTPPPGRPLWEAYLCDWQWPAMQITRMSQELNTLLNAVDKRVIDPDTVTTSMFGMRPEVRARRAAKAAARDTALGFVQQEGRETWSAKVEAAKRILAESEAEEARERDLVEASSREDGALDADAE
ncbi:phage portal protein [Methylorubrum sp. DB1722]|uniref:phage portal protein n=1 Tax=Methylorubrum sp. DB1722 TaxID=2478916 RepID=UPI0018E3ABD1|nr:phage portal protein [Methylorubrum sp. DB1722]MBI1689523.1 phage portal protein [Methylorubrum sp. DB1722]